MIDLATLNDIVAASSSVCGLVLCEPKTVVSSVFKDKSTIL